MLWQSDIHCNLVPPGPLAGWVLADWLSELHLHWHWSTELPPLIFCVCNQSSPGHLLWHKHTPKFLDTQWLSQIWTSCQYKLFSGSVHSAMFLANISIYPHCGTEAWAEHPQAVEFSRTWLVQWILYWNLRLSPGLAPGQHFDHKTGKRPGQVHFKIKYPLISRQWFEIPSKTHSGTPSDHPQR